MLGLQEQPEYVVVWKKPVNKRFWVLVSMAVVTLLLVVVTPQVLLWSFSQLSESQVRFYTHNIRYDHPDLDDGEKPWLKRKDQLVKSIQFNAGSELVVVGLQEVLRHQLDDVLAGLNERDDEWVYFGKGRDDGKDEGEFAPVLYKQKQWKLVQSEVYWLSPHPDRPSKGWDAALKRIVTVVTLRLKQSPLIEIKVLVTHFDHKGVEARKQAAAQIGELMDLSSVPAFLMGDLNTEPLDEPHKVLSDLGFQDSNILAGKMAFGEKYTFTGFNRKNEEKSVIDYIWAPSYAYAVTDEKPKQEFQVELKHFAILGNYLRGDYISDHRPVVADYRIKHSVFK